MSDSISIRYADNNDYLEVYEMLRELNLPTDGLKEHLHRFLLLIYSNNIIGVFGIEIYVSVGLLRSLGVRKGYQGLGYGTRLIEAMEDYISESKLDTIYLFTETADKMFVKRGYQYISRESADPIIQQSLEWTICSSVPLLFKKL